MLCEAISPTALLKLVMLTLLTISYPEKKLIQFFLVLLQKSDRADVVLFVVYRARVYELGILSMFFKPFLDRFL
jgi:hypothetical protein